MNRTTWRDAAAGLLAVGALMVAPAAPAGASTTIATTAGSGFRLTLQADRTEGVSTTLSTGRVALTGGLATQTGKAGLCYPASFHPGVGATGYCWNNTADDSGSGGWFPQGFSVPHTSTGDGVWNGIRWEVSSWHNTGDTQSKLRFTNRSVSPPRFFDASLNLFNAGTVSQRAAHVDGVAWYGDRLYVTHGRTLDIVELADLTTDGGMLRLPVRYTYLTTTSSCVPAAGTTPCMNGVSFDRSRGALLTNEYYNTTTAGGRLISWPLDLSTGLPTGTAQAAWISPVVKMQGVTFDGSDFFISGTCPANVNNSYREPACVHKGAAESTTTVLTQVPDMTQNLDWDASTGRIRGINEVSQSGQVVPQRLVFDFAPAATPVTTVGFRNAVNLKCLLPYANRLNNGTYVIQSDCNDGSAQDWYRNGAEIRSLVSDRCITVNGGSNANNATMTVWECNGSDYQKWTLVAGDGGSLLKNTGSGRCLVPYGGSTADSTEMVQWTCDTTSAAQAWTGSPW